MSKEKTYGLSYQTAWQTDVQILPILLIELQ